MKTPKYLVISLCFLTSFYLFSQEQKIPEPVIQAERAIYNLGVQERTGFLLENGLLVTAFHGFVSNTSGVPFINDRLDRISLSQNGTPSNIKIKALKAVSAYMDLSILEVEGDVQHFLSEGKISSPEEKFFSVGYPENSSTIHYMKSINVLKEISSFHYAIPLNFSMLNGMSGSPLLNVQGQFVGINLANAENNISFGVMSNQLNSLMEGRIGTQCEGSAKACIEQELKAIRKQVNIQLNPDYEIKKTDQTLFHHPLGLLFSILQRHQIEPYLLKGSQLGFSSAKINLAEYYRSGSNLYDISVRPDSGMIIQEPKFTGTAYQQAQEINSQNYEREMKQAADQGDVFAQESLGLYYENKSHSMSAKQNKENNQSSFNRDPSIDQMLDQAVYYLKLAANQGSAASNYGLARIHYMEGDREQGLKRLKKAGDQGDRTALQRLSLMYLTGEDGVEQHFEKALYYALQLEQQGVDTYLFFERLKKEAKTNASALYALGLYHIQSADKNNPAYPHQTRSGFQMIMKAGKKGFSKALQWLEKEQHRFRYCERVFVD